MILLVIMIIITMNIIMIILGSRGFRAVATTAFLLPLRGRAALEHAGAELLLPGVGVLRAPLQGARGVSALAGLHDRADDLLSLLCLSLLYK